MKINRRAFLKGLSAFTTLPFLTGLDLDLKKDVENAWAHAVENPYVFNVDGYGYLSKSDFHEPQVRHELYDIDVDSIRTVADLKDAVTSSPPLEQIMSGAYDNFLGELRFNERQGSTGKIEEGFDTYDGWDDELVEKWRAKAGTNAFLEDIKSRIEKWLGEPPDWSEEYDYFDKTATAEAAAFDYFVYSANEFIEPLCIEIIDGVCPGNDFQGARLGMEVEEANDICRTEGIPVRFVEI